MANDKLYMIRRRTDGMYSSGGSWPGFGTKGKIWNSMGALNTHLSQVYYNELSKGKDGKQSVLSIEKFADMRSNPYYECDIVEVKVNPTYLVDVFSHLALRYQKE